VITRLSPRHLLLATGLTLLLGACSAGAPAPTAVPNGPATPPSAASAPAAVAGTSPAPVSGSGDSDASCTLVTKDAVGQATGFPIATTSGAAGICYFQNTDPSKYLVVWVFGNQAAMAAMLQIEDSSEHVAGLGDDAFWSGAGGILFVRKGDHGVEFQDPDFVFTPDTNTAPRDALVTLARTALPNL